MISCPRCGTKFHESEPNCPNCGVARAQISVSRPENRRCGPVAFFLLQCARIFALLGGVGAAFVGIKEIVTGYTGNGIFSLFIVAPVSFGHFVALGLVMQYAEWRA